MDPYEIASVQPPRVHHGTTIIEVIVGDSHETFKIHDSLFCAASHVFRDMTPHPTRRENGSSLTLDERGELSLDMEHEHPGIFKLFYDWLYSGRVLTNLGTYLIFDGQPPDDFWWCVLLFAERYEIRRLILLAANHLETLFSPDEPVIPSQGFMKALFRDESKEISCFRKYVCQHIAFWLEKSADREVWYPCICAPESEAGLICFAHAVTRNDGSHPMGSSINTKECKYNCHHSMPSVLNDEDINMINWDSLFETEDLECAELMEPISNDDDTGAVDDSAPQVDTSQTDPEPEASAEDDASASAWWVRHSRPSSRVFSEHSPLSTLKPTKCPSSTPNIMTPVCSEASTQLRSDSQHNKTSWEAQWDAPAVPAPSSHETPTIKPNDQPASRMRKQNLNSSFGGLTLNQIADSFVEPKHRGVPADNIWNMQRPVAPGPLDGIGAPVTWHSNRPLYVSLPVPFHGGIPHAIPYGIPGPQVEQAPGVQRQNLSTTWDPPTVIATAPTTNQDRPDDNRNNDWTNLSESTSATERRDREGRHCDVAKEDSWGIKNEDREWGTVACSENGWNGWND